MIEMKLEGADGKWGLDKSLAQPLFGFLYNVIK